MRPPAQDAITMSQAATIIIMAIVIVIHVEIMWDLLHAAGRDAWVAEILTFPLMAFYWWAIVKIAKQAQGERIIDLVRFGWLRWMIILIVELYCVGSLFRAVSTYSSFTSMIVLPGVPEFLISAIFLSMSIWIARHGLSTIAVVIGILFPFVVFFGITNTISTQQMKDYEFLFPIWELGIKPSLRGMVIAFSTLADFFVFLFIAHLIQSKNGTKFGPWFLTLILVYIMALGLVMGLIAEFGPYELLHRRFPPYEGWRLVTFGSYLERMDYLAIYQWLAGGSARVMLLLFIASELLVKPKHRLWGIIGLGILVLILAGIPIGPDMMAVIRNLYVQFSVVVELLIPLLLFISIKRPKVKAIPGGSA